MKKIDRRRMAINAEIMVINFTSSISRCMIEKQIVNAFTGRDLFEIRSIFETWGYNGEDELI